MIRFAYSNFVSSSCLPPTEPPCSAPEEIEHGLTDWDGKSGVARYACFQGYHLVGPPKVRERERVQIYIY